MNKLLKLKNILNDRKMDAYYIPKNDMYFSEELIPVDERLEYITNFTGSAGFSIILSNTNHRSAIFSDGRYELQIEKEVDNKKFEYFIGGLSKIIDFLNSKKKIIKKIGFDPNLLSINDYRNIKNKLKEMKINLIKINENLVDKVWYEKPKIPMNNIYNISEKYTGLSSSKKLNALVKVINSHDANAYFLFRPDCLSWLLNVRDSQLKYTPVLRASAIITNNNEILIFSDRKINKQFATNSKNIFFYEYKLLKKTLLKFQGQKIIIDPKVTPVKIFDLLKNNKNVVKELNCPVLETKCVKNIVEQKNSKYAHLMDGISFLRFWDWLESQFDFKNLNEEVISNKLYYFRKLNDEFVCNSFATIAATGKNGAIVHYKFKENKSSILKNNSLLLIDSGGQYIIGTTDVTRTLILGNPTKEMINFYTYVLKGHIAFSKLIFPHGTKGSEIDSIARVHLWKNCEDYDHGTGHGVGHFLNVHEEPISISKNNHFMLSEGMIISNEPGYYKKNKFGIRIENLELIKKVMSKKNKKTFLCFDTLTLIPYEKKLINKSLLNENELNYVNNYHKVVYSKIKSHLKFKDKNLKNFLLKKTSPL